MPHKTAKHTLVEFIVGRKLRTRLDSLKPNINERIQKQRSEKITKGEFVLVRDYRDSHKWKQGVIDRDSHKWKQGVIDRECHKWKQGVIDKDSHKWKQEVIISTCNWRCDTKNTMNPN